MQSKYTLGDLHQRCASALPRPSRSSFCSYVSSCGVSSLPHWALRVGLCQRRKSHSLLAFQARVQLRQSSFLLEKHLPCMLERHHCEMFRACPHCPHHMEGVSLLCAENHTQRHLSCPIVAVDLCK